MQRDRQNPLQANPAHLHSWLGLYLLLCFWAGPPSTLASTVTGLPGCFYVFPSCILHLVLTTSDFFFSFTVIISGASLYHRQASLIGEIHILHSVSQERNVSFWTCYSNEDPPFFLPIWPDSLRPAGPRLPLMIHGIVNHVILSLFLISHLALCK